MVNTIDVSIMIFLKSICKCQIFNSREIKKILIGRIPASFRRGIERRCDSLRVLSWKRLVVFGIIACEYPYIALSQSIYGKYTSSYSRMQR